MDSAQFAARIEQIYRDLDAYTYYELLNLPPEALPDQIQQAFHRMALMMHPDRHAGSQDAQLRSKLYVIYKRVSEGYRVLMNHQTRAEYHHALERGERRLVKKERQQKRLKRKEDQISHPRAKKFFSMAEDAARRGDKKGAEINYKFALDLLGEEHPLIMQRLADLRQSSDDDD